MRVAVYDQDGAEVGDIDLADAVFAAPPLPATVHQAVVRYLANQRQGTADTKTRGQVAGGGRKPWRQKGTGHARQGSTRSPIWRKGGVAFGPHPRDFRQEMPRKARRAALRAVLSDRARGGDLLVLEDLVMQRPQTRAMVATLAALGLPASTLIVTNAADTNVYRSARNLPGTGVSHAGQLNVYEVLAHRKLVLTRAAVAKVQEVLVSAER